MKSTTSVGNHAETLVCEFLVARSYKIVERNYRDRFCEIDIIACNKSTIAFVEVKYRRRTDFGGAIGAITPDKLRRMTLSAEFWLSQHEEYFKLQPRLDVVTVAGDLQNPQINHLENIS